MAVRPEPRLFTVDEFLQMAETGVLADDARLELIDGEIVSMTPIGRTHAACVNVLSFRLITALGRTAVVTVQNPVQLDARTQVCPDLAVLQPRADFYKAHLPLPGDVLLLVEVADSTLAFDLGTKALKYAQAGVPEVWVVDLGTERILVHRTPTPGGYQSITEGGRGAVLGPEALPGLVLGVSDILG